MARRGLWVLLGRQEDRTQPVDLVQYVMLTGEALADCAMTHRFGQLFYSPLPPLAALFHRADRQCTFGAPLAEVEVPAVGGCRRRQSYLLGTRCRASDVTFDRQTLIRSPTARPLMIRERRSSTTAKPFCKPEVVRATLLWYRAEGETVGKF